MSIIGDYFERLLTVFPSACRITLILVVTSTMSNGVKLCQLIFLLQTSNSVSQGDSLGYLTSILMILVSYSPFCPLVVVFYLMTQQFLVLSKSYPDDMGLLSPFASYTASRWYTVLIIMEITNVSRSMIFDIQKLINVAVPNNGSVLLLGRLHLVFLTGKMHLAVSFHSNTMRMSFMV